MRPRIGIIGAGNIAGAHGRAIHYLTKEGIIDGELVAVCDSDPERRESFAAAARASHTFEDPAELIASPEVNTVYVCTPTVFHREQATLVLEAGKALFCEKPLAFNAADAVAIRDAAAESGVTHQVGLVLRFSPVISVLRDLLQDEALGRPMAAVMVDDQFFPIRGHYNSTWRGDVRLVGAGTLLEHAIHDVDVLCWYFGRVKRVFGVTRHFFEKEGVEDLSSETLEFENGAVVNHVSVWHNLDHRGSSRRMHVICENGQFSWEDDDWAAPIRTETNELGRKDEIPSEEVVARYLRSVDIPERLRERATFSGFSYVLENYAFLKAVTDDRPGFPDFDTAVYAHEVVDAIYESARTGLPVEMS
ncbi:MAG: Gfo/Idh/MocA family oxidoreductase [Dehalococcoidia bacterium]